MNVNRIIQDYRQVYGTEPAAVAHAPGRVNMIGEHVDYNAGCVLPFAIDRRVIAAATADDSGIVSAHSTSLSAAVSFNVNVAEPVQPASWENYVRGMAYGLRQVGVSLGGAKLLIGGDLMPGSGLSSSAALCIAVGNALAKAAGADLTPEEMARIAQAAEHNFAGTPCGLMDQYASCFGRRDHALLLDCRDLSFQHVPFDPAGVTLLLIPSGVKHSLADGEYEQRVHACQEAVRGIAADNPDVQTLRDVSEQMLEAYRERLTPLCRRRARHVVTECARVAAAVEAIAADDWPRLGELLWETQESLRDDYAVSCPEIDEIIAVLREHQGVLGARMIGGGFGGVVLALVTDDHAAAVQQALRRRYYGPHGLTEEPFCVRPADGATVVAAP